MVVKVNFFGGDQTAHVVLILQQLNKTLSKTDGVTNNDVLGFDSRLLFLSADIIAPILTKLYRIRIRIRMFIYLTHIQYIIAILT